MSKADFYNAIRPMFGGSLTSEQVQGIEALLDATQGLPIGHRAYLLATAKHETADTMQPIHERGKKAYFNKYEPGTRIGNALGNTKPGDGYLFRGRGFVQLTGRANYAKASKKLGVDLVGNPDAALDAQTAARILIQGCMEGWFTGKKLDDYLPDSFLEARRVVNGTDRAQDIAQIAIAFGNALAVMGDEPKPQLSTTDPQAFGLSWLVKFIMQAIGLLTWRKK